MHKVTYVTFLNSSRGLPLLKQNEEKYLFE